MDTSIVHDFQKRTLGRLWYTYESKSLQIITKCDEIMTHYKFEDVQHYITLHYGKKVWWLWCNDIIPSLNRTHDYDTGAIMVSVALIVTVIFMVTVAATLLAQCARIVGTPQ